MSQKNAVNNMTLESLHAKYGDVKVAVVPAAAFDKINELTVEQDVEHNIEFMPRWAMETDESFLQPIPYVLVMNERGEYLATRRKQGDARLVGMVSLGVGGHMDAGERVIHDAMCRELNEELVLKGLDENPLCEFMGVIRERETPVDRVHLGLVYRVMVSDSVCVRETDVLDGEWLSADEIERRYDALESWGKVCCMNGWLRKPMGHKLLTTKILKVYERKNSDYGNSFAETHKLFGAVAGLTRIHDKLNRIAQLASGKAQKVMDEKLMDTILDGATYCLMEIEQITGKALADIAVQNLANLWPVPQKIGQYIKYVMDDMANADGAVLRRMGNAEYFLSCVFNDLIHFAAWLCSQE